MSTNIMTTTDSEQPYFDFGVQRNITVSVGQTGFLHCSVERLGDKDVSMMIKLFIVYNWCGVQRPFSIFIRTPMLLCIA